MAARLPRSMARDSILRLFQHPARSDGRSIPCLWMIDPTLPKSTRPSLRQRRRPLCVPLNSVKTAYILIRRSCCVFGYPQETFSRVYSRSNVYVLTDYQMYHDDSLWTSITRQPLLPDKDTITADAWSDAYSLSLKSSLEDEEVETILWPRGVGVCSPLG